MPVDFRTEQVLIPSGTGHRTFESQTFFNSKVIRAGVALNGFNLDFTGNVDRHINVLEADTDIISVSGTTVNFNVHCQYADVNFDDPYGGYITVLVIAEVE